MKYKLLKGIIVMTKYAFYTLFTLMLCFGTMLASETNAQKPKSVRKVIMDVQFKNVTLQEAFHQIEQKTSYRFTYDVNDINTHMRLDFRAKKVSLYQILKHLSKEGLIRFKQTNFDIDVQKISEQDKGINTVEVQLQSITVTGKVISGEDNQGLPGVNVVVKGTSQGTVTDLEGNYSLDVPGQNSILVFSSVGFVQEEIAVGNQTVIDMTMVPDITALEEIVVIGYGTSKRRDVVGSVSKIGGEMLDNNINHTSIEQSIQGLSSGLSVRNSSGNPGSIPNIKIRGINSINLNSNPLWIVDGVPIQTGSIGANTDDGVTAVSAISMINPSDIESVEVLKDAAATAIYGSRASAGVIIITTKSNKAGKTGLTVDYNASLSEFTFSMGDYFADSETWWTIMDLATDNAVPVRERLTPEYIMSFQFWGDKPAMTREEAFTTNTDQMDAISQQAFSHQVGLTVTKGFDKGGMILTASYRNEDGIVRSNNLDRYTLRYNINFKPIKALEVGLSSNMMYIDAYGVTSPGSAGTKGLGGFGNLLSTLPWYKLYDPNSETGYWAATSGYNPLAFSDSRLYSNNAKNYRTISNVYMQWSTPIEGLSVRTDAGIDMGILKNSFWRSGLLNWSKNENSAFERTNYVAQTNWHIYSNYAKSVGNSSFDITIGTEATNTWGYEQYMSAADVQTTYPELINPLQMKEMTGKQNKEKFLMGVFARANYKLADKYILHASARRDGISAFSEKNRWANFYAVGAGWIISDESLFDNLDFINLLKLRGSHGTTGNTNVSNDMTYTVWSLETERLFGVSTINGATKVGPIGSDNLRWEISTKTDIGIDFGLFGNRINGSFAYYEQNISDLILKTNLPLSIGYDKNELYENTGDMENKGIEFNIQSVNVSQSQFSWKTDFNFTTSHNKIVRLNETEKGQGNIGWDDIRKEGEALNTYFLANYVNIDPQKGIPMMEERNQEIWENEFVTTSTGSTIPMNNNNVPNNRMVQSGKTKNPTYFGGMINTLKYRGIDLILQLSYAGGHWLFNDVAQESSRLMGIFNLDKDLVSKSWQQPGDMKDYPAIVYNNQYNYDNEGNPITGTTLFDRNAQTTRFLEKGDYIRLNNLQLGYTFPESIVSRKYVRSLRFYAGVRNLFTITKYGGFDPEIGDMNALPVLRTYNFGISIEL